MKIHLLKLAAIKLALLLTVSAVGCSASLANPGPKAPGTERAEYVRDPINNCRAKAHYGFSKRWDFHQEKVVIDRGNTYYECADGVYFIIWDDEVQP